MGGWLDGWLDGWIGTAEEETDPNGDGNGEGGGSCDVPGSGDGLGAASRRLTPGGGAAMTSDGRGMRTGDEGTGCTAAGAGANAAAAGEAGTAGDDGTGESISELEGEAAAAVEARVCCWKHCRWYSSCDQAMSDWKARMGSNSGLVRVCSSAGSVQRGACSMERAAGSVQQGACSRERAAGSVQPEAQMQPKV